MAAIHKLLAAKTTLITGLETSRAMATGLQQAGQRLEGMTQRLPSLETQLAPDNARSFSAIKEQIDRAVCPSMAVLKVCKAVQDLEKSLVLDDPRSDLSAYLLLIKRFEQALKFLRDNCCLAIQWLEDILQLLQENTVANDLYVCKVKMCLSVLRNFQATEERARINGGIFCVAFNKLEDEFKQLLAENSNPVTFPLFNEEQACISPSPLPEAVVQKLQVIAGKLSDHHRLQRCMSAYIDVRSRNARRSLHGLDLKYLERKVTEVDDVQDIEGFIHQWCEQLELAVTHVYQAEYKLCNEVLGKFKSSDDRMTCFAEIATQSGILSFLHFGANVVDCKKDPVKLLKLLDMFSCLDKLRADFNRYFTGEACGEIQNLTRNLIKKVVCGAYEIFWELPFQVELQRRSSPPPDGSVPKLVSFVTEYCNYLLDNDYKSLLIKVLTIYQSWKNDKYQDTLLTSQLNSILKEIGVNLDSWSQTYDDKALSYLFMMNNHSHFCNLKGTSIGELMGDSWIRGHKQYKDYYMTLYLKETWGTIISMLRQDQAPENLTMKKRLKAFNEALDGMYEKQCGWVVPDEELRLTMCRVAVQAFVPVYRSYLQNFVDLEQEDVKYTAQGLESLLSTLFQPKLRMYGGNKLTLWIDEVKNIETDHSHHLTLMAL